MTPDRLSVTLTEAAQLAQGPLSQRLEIHLLLDFEGLADPDHLRRALALALDASPAMGSALRPRFFNPFWERLPLPLLEERALEIPSPGEDVKTLEARFLADAIDVRQGPQARALLLETEGRQRLILKAAHVVPDAAGVKAFSGLFSRTYRALGENSGHVPQPLPDRRELSFLYKRFSFWEMARRVPGMLVRLMRQSVPPKPLCPPSGRKMTGEPRFRLVRLDVRPFMDYARKHGATLNDLLAAAFIRALARTAPNTGKFAHRISQTFDLRRYVPGELDPGAALWTSGFFPNLGGNPGQSLDEALGRLKPLLDDLKENRFSLTFLWCLLALSGLPFGLKTAFMRAGWKGVIRAGLMGPVLTNMGRIAPETVDFGEPRTARAELVVPALNPPCLGVGVSTFANTLTLSAGTYPEALPQELLTDLFNALKNELPG